MLINSNSHLDSVIDTVGNILDPGDRIFVVLKDRLNLLEERLACKSQGYGVAVTVLKTDSQFILDAADLTAHGRLGDM